MALVVEDGSMVTGAESYCTVAAATTYHAARGNSAWAAVASDTIREQLLRKATDYIEGKYRARWDGYKNSATQPLTWPRAFVYVEPFYLGAVGAYPYLVASNIVPAEVVKACAELALRAIAGDLLGDQTQQVLREKIGPIEVDYDKFSPQDTRYAAIDALLRPYIRKSEGALKMVRA